MLRSSTVYKNEHCQRRREKRCQIRATQTAAKLFAQQHTRFPFHHHVVSSEDIWAIVNENKAVALVIVAAGKKGVVD
jgi:hypothetical protein